MPNCTNCSNAIFDTVWGEYKCSIYKRTVYNHEVIGCKYYNEGQPKESIDNASYQANLQDS